MAPRGRRKDPENGDVDGETQSKKRRVQRQEDREDTPAPDDENNPETQQNMESAEELENVDNEDLLSMKIPDRPAAKMSTDPTAPRLVITKIVVDNFKSYYGKQTLGPFHKNFTSILGPNGSGKSNVIDALLFVFGFRASKIRSKKISVLIHNSSAHPNVKSCTVSVHFAKIIDKGTSCEIQEGSEFHISRTATKSGSSTYRINGLSSNTGQVREKLKSNGIDLDHNRFLILQGEVEQISLMKPKRSERSEEDGMLEYLEDIIGSSRLKVPIDKFKKKIEKLTHNEDIVQKRLQLAESEVSTLVKPVRQVILLMRIENTITKTKHKIFSIDRQGVLEQSEACKREVEEQKKNHCEAENQLVECNEEIKRLQKDRADLTKDESNFREKIYDTDKKRQEKEMEKRDKINEINQNEKRQEKRENDIAKDNKKLTEAEAAPAKAEANIKEYQEEIDRLKAEIAEYEEKLKNLNPQEREANKENRIELNSIMPQITELSTEENEWVQKISLANDTLERLMAAASDPQKQLEVAENRAKEIQNALRTQETELANIEAKVPELARKIRENEMTQNEKRRKEHEMQSRINEMRQQIENNRREASNTLNNAALNALMIEKRSGRILGIYGRLGDLGGIDEAYDVSISSCCPQLDNIVVDTVETAQECVEFVRNNGLGRVNFIALDKQQSLWNQIRNRPRTPEDAPRFIDLITTTDENVRPAFFSVLRNTLFAETIDDATRISNTPVDGISRWRVATKNGELVETSGTMTGGGNRVVKGRMGKHTRVDTSQPTTSENDLRKMEEEVVVLRNQLNGLRAELSNAMDQLRNQKEEYSKLEHDQRIYTAGIPKIRQQLERANQEVAKFKNIADSAQVDESQVNEMKQKIKDFEERKEAVCKRASALRKQKEELSSKIESVETRILGKTRDHLKKLKKSQTKAEDECKKEQLILKNSSNTIDKIKRSIKNSEDAVTKSKDELVHLKSDLTRLEGKIESTVAQKAQYEQRLKETIAEIQQINTTLEERTKFSEDIQKTIEEQRRDLTAAENKARSLMEKLNEIECNIGKLSLFTLRAGVKLPDMPAVQPSVTAQEVEENNQPAEAQENENQQDQSVMEVDNNEAEGNQMEIDAQTEELPLNATVDDADVTTDPACDQGMLPSLNAEEIQRLNRDELVLKLESYKKKKERCPGKMNLDLIDEYADKVERRDGVLADMERLKDFLDKHRAKYRELTQMRNDEFNDGFQKICIATQEIYQMITLGGDASLEKVNSMDTFKDGITFQVRPPKKTWKQITNLSGGEKTLASLALVFGLHNFRPTPLYVMDEIDAALDYRNVSIISTYLKERTKNAQFIIISLRNNMFENGDRLLGIYKVNDCTHNVIYDTECMDGDETDDEDE